MRVIFFLSFYLFSTFLSAAIVRVDSASDERVLGKMLDEGNAAKGDVYFYFGRELSVKRAKVIVVDKGKGLIGLETTGYEVRAGDLFLDKDWFVVMALLSRGGDIEAVSKIVSDLPGESAFPNLGTNSLEGFKVQVGNALMNRLAIVEKLASGQDNSSGYLLKITIGDFLFRYSSDFAQAYRYYLEGLKDYPKLGPLQLQTVVKAGDCQLNLKKFDEALSWYGRALTKYKLDAEFYTKEIASLEKKMDVINRHLGELKADVTPIPATSLLRQKIVDYARTLLDQTWSFSDTYFGKHFLFDCQGTVSKIFWTVGIDLTRNYEKPEFQNLLGGVPRIFMTYKNENKTYLSKRSKPGDLVFFDNTWDYNGNGRFDDPMTHIALVESVDSDGTINIIHHCSKGIKRYQLNLDKPNVYQDETGKVINSFIRRQSASDPAGTSYLLGSYVSGFADALGGG
jgi:tetratricopeptide (TPR) repeat protein